LLPADAHRAALALTPALAHPEIVSTSQEDNESAPNLYIEFEEDETVGAAAAAEVISDVEAIGVAPHGRVPRRGPGWAWSALSSRGRRAVAGAVVLIGLGAAVGDALVAQAAQRAADRPTVALVDASYTITLDGSGLNLLINVTDTGTAPVTVTQAQVQGLGVNLRYSGIPLSVGRAQQLELVLSGEYDCVLAASSDGTAASPKTVRVTVRTVHGTVSTLDLVLPASAELPGRWRGDRAGLCGWGS
jgi:hypothetical protein